MPSYDKRLRTKRLVKLREVIKHIDATAAYEKALARKSETCLDEICKKYGVKIKK